MKKITLLYAIVLSICISCVNRQNITENMVIVNFADTLQDWDGFGVNYVETCQTSDYDKFSQDYGGFSKLTENQRQEIIELIFGEDGLKPNIIKMFLDPFHEQTKNSINDNNDPYSINDAGFDHERTTKWMRYFVSNGLQKLQKQNINPEIITTLYGPPGWMSLQKQYRGRDLDPAMKEELGEYMVSWVKYLQNNGYPVKYFSLHNEGEDYKRWGKNGFTTDFGHDYNMYWSPEQVVDFIKFMPGMFEKHGVKPVGITPGETSSWMRFIANSKRNKTSYASQIGMDEEALNNLSLITSHSFWMPMSAGIDFIHKRHFSWGDPKSVIHVWTTSSSWKNMTTDFISYFYDEIYISKTNAIIPWACVQHHESWIDGDPNPGCAIKVTDDGEYIVRPGYYFYKILSRAGQQGMKIMNTYSDNQDIKVIAFGSNSTKNEDAFVVINNSETEQVLTLKIKKNQYKKYMVYRTSVDNEQYVLIGEAETKNDILIYKSPAQSVTSFLGSNK